MKNAVKILSIAFMSVLILTGCFGFDERPGLEDIEIIPVESITGIPTGSLPFIALTLSGTVMPEDATNKKIEWLIADNGASAALEGNKLTANSEGMVTVKAVIKDGIGENIDYTQNFDIQFSLISPIPVIEIKGIPTSITRGTYTLSGKVIPSNALNTTILWSVKDAGSTGASIYCNVLTTTAPGTAVIAATIENGLLENGDYTQDFTISITKNVYLAGHYGSPYKACYWIDDKLYDLDLSGIPDGTISITTGIVFAGGKQYISGGYGGTVSAWGEITTATACYWVDGTRHDLGGTQTLSIAADGDDVYITGRNNSEYCYWKIENGTATKQTLTIPSGTGTLRYEGRLAVSGGDVYIPFYYQSGITTSGTALNENWRAVTLTSSYWDKNGTRNNISLTNYAVKCATIVNGDVYMAGFMRQDEGIFPFYWVMGAASSNPNTGSYGNWSSYEYDYNSMIISSNRVNPRSDDGVGSIVAQNGAPWFYCTRTGTHGSEEMEFRYDTAGNGKFLSPTDFMYDAGKLVFSEGDVYIVLRRSAIDNYSKKNNIAGDWIFTGNYVGYAVLDGGTVSEKKTYVLIDPDGKKSSITRGQISGIAVP